MTKIERLAKMVKHSRTSLDRLRESYLLASGRDTMTFAERTKS